MSPWDASAVKPGAADADAGATRAVRCRACGEALTMAERRCEAAGAHEHAYLNPAGIVYRFACFADAPGCRVAGAASREWSWFEGHAWRVAVCGACAAHVGWRFDPHAGEGGFFGLILDRIVAGY